MTLMVNVILINGNKLMNCSLVTISIPAIVLGAEQDDITSMLG